MFTGNGAYDINAAQNPTQWNAAQHQGSNNEAEGMEGEDGDNTRRPPNAFILYSQAMRSQVRQENPSLSNTECSRLLGKMWKDVPNDVKLQYKQKAAAMQEDFKREHPDYTYRKARRKRALNELLTKSTHGYPPFMPPGFPNPDMNQWGMMGQQNPNPGMFPMSMQPFPQQQNNQMQYPMAMYGNPQMGGMPSGNPMFHMNQYPGK